MFKFIIPLVIVSFSVIFSHLQPVVAMPRPGDFRDAVEEVDVPPEHRAAPPQSAQPSVPLYPRAIFPAMPGTYPLFFQTPTGFVPFANTYNAYPALAPTIAI
uniref:DUF4794 domain-containing protein n=1 Tax=Glossina austeni TaxID=7395 RepID=A0A1A9UJ50_GLOAU